MKTSNHRVHWERHRDHAFNVAAAADQAVLSAFRTEIYHLLETGASFPEAKQALQNVVDDFAGGRVES